MNKFTLFLRDKSIALEYKLLYTNQIFIIGVVLSLIRILRLSFSLIIDGAHDNDILFIPDSNRGYLKWIVMGIQALVILSQRIFPKQLNSFAIPVWIALSSATLNVTSDESYPTYLFVFK